MLFVKNMLVSALALAGVAAPAAAMAPLSNDVHTETAGAQEIGSTTSDGFLIYSLNVCTIVQTTVCETSISTGAPAPSYGIPSDTSEPYEDSASTEYPVPTGGDNPPSATDGSPTATITDGYTQTITTDGSDETAIDTATSSAPPPSGTDDGGQQSSSSDGAGSSATAPPSSTETTDAPSQGFSYTAAAHWGIKYILLIALLL